MGQVVCQSATGFQGPDIYKLFIQWLLAVYGHTGRPFLFSETFGPDV